MVIISLKAFANDLFLRAFPQAFMFSLKGLLWVISCVGRYHRSPFSPCNRGLGVSDTHFHCVSDNTPTPPPHSWYPSDMVLEKSMNEIVNTWLRCSYLCVCVCCRGLGGGGWRLHCWHFLHESMPVEGSFAMVNLVWVLSVAVFTK